MVLSVMPAACNLAIFSLAGFEKLHSNMAQVATVSLQPHWQPMWAPTRRTSPLGFSAAVCARARGAPGHTKAMEPFSEFPHIPSLPGPFGAGVLHLDFTWH